MEAKTKKKELDKMLKRLQKMQIELFKKGSKACLEVWPRWRDNMYVIHVTGYNDSKPRRELNYDGTTEVYCHRSFDIYSFHYEDRNEKVMKDIVEYLDLDSDGQR